MLKLTICAGLVVLLAGTASAAVYTVTNADDTGAGSLREALNAANLSAGADSIVFDASMTGKVITPAIHLPVIRSDGTVIRGDINGDGLPDVGINGARILATDISPSGLVVDANDCKLIGLAIGRFPRYGIEAWDISNLEVRACHVSVQLDGATSWTNRWGAILLSRCTDCRIGLAGANNRNIIAAGTATELLTALNLMHCQRVTVSNNYIGVTRAGNRTFPGSGVTGIWVSGQDGAEQRHVLGGTQAGTGNVIAGLRNGIILDASSYNTIAGNKIGLNAVGNGALPIAEECISLYAGSHHTTVGSPLRAGRNFLASAQIALSVRGPNNHHDVIQNNWFGLNAAGTAVLPLCTGVYLCNDATDVTVGGSGNLTGNRFVVTDKSNGNAYGVVITDTAGADTLVRFNKFGYYGDNTVAPGSDVALFSSNAQRLAVLDNYVAQHSVGVQAFGNTTVDIYRNRFVACDYAVQLWENALGRLGQLDDTDATNDGGNRFRASCIVAVHNHTPHNVRAEGNDWATSSRFAINARIHDGHDEAGCGEVDFDPLLGGLHPTAAEGVAVVSAMALPTNQGAEVLVQAATGGALTVEVRNMAGRLVAAPATAQACPAGLSRVLWNGRSLTGTRVPPGRYWVRATVRGAAGAQASGLCGLDWR